MSKLTSKIAFPIILTGVFVIVVFAALGYEQLAASIYIVILLLAVFIFFFGFFIGQNFSSPVKELLKKANDLSQGNLSSRVYLKTKDELSELAKTFNTIAENLEQSYNRGENAEKSIESKVRIQTQAMQESINALEQKIRNRTEGLGRAINELEKTKRSVARKETEISKLRKEVDELKIKQTNHKAKKIKKI